MKKKELQQDLCKLNELLKKRREANERLTRSIENLNDSLLELQIRVKYLVFENEALKREKKALREQLGNL